MIVFDVGALNDIERIFEFNAQRDPLTAIDHVEVVRSAVAILGAHPEIGQPAGRNSTLRELVIFGRVLVSGLSTAEAAA